ncbi:MAG: protein phosphatase 2C domain-containing protein [Aggregatilineales bacterium]
MLPTDLLTKTIRLRSAQVIGRDHLLREVNCQDSHALVQTDDFIAGVVCDGCGEGQYSEVGATLGAKFIITQIINLLDEGALVQEIPDLLYPRIVDYLSQLTELSQPMNRTAFVQHHLLFTIVGVIVADGRTVIFSAGDGLFIIDKVRQRIEQDNKPQYIAYHLLADSLKSGVTLPDKFDIQYAKGWQKLAVATDGFDETLSADIWGMEHPRALQRRLNVWSSQEKRFADDTALITLERLIEHAE